MFATTIENEHINALELSRFEGRIHMVQTEAELSKAIRQFSKEKAVGFDTESKPAFKKGEYNHISLIQVSTESEAWLIRVNKTGIPDNLKAFLEDEQILKVGVALRDDLKDLKKLRPMNPEGFVELNHLVKDIGIEANGLRKLTAIILGFRISKSAQVSNWEKDELTEKQINYAATDAWVCIAMYNKLVRQGYLEH